MTIAVDWGVKQTNTKSILSDFHSLNSSIMLEQSVYPDHNFPGHAKISMINQCSVHVLSSVTASIYDHRGESYH